MKVLTVEDMASVRKVIVDIIRSLGHEAIEAEGGQAGLERLDEHPEIALVLLDREMPGMSGIEFLEHVRAEDRATKLPVVMVSSWADPKWIIEALEAGADDFLCKPFSPELLSTCIVRQQTS